MSRVKLQHVTPDAEEHIMYCARVSNPKGQDSKNTKLLRYCLSNGHWSIFEMASMCVEIETNRGIMPQFLRHWSFSFQEFSQRYQDVSELGDEMFDFIMPRRQDAKNKQNSFDDLTLEQRKDARVLIERAQQLSTFVYRDLLEMGIAKECARFVLPLSTKTRFYMHGNIRSWITYFIQRLDKATQKEHREIAIEVYDLHFKKHLPTIAEAFEEQYPQLFGNVDIITEEDLLNACGLVDVQYHAELEGYYPTRALIKISELDGLMEVSSSFNIYNFTKENWKLVPDGEVYDHHELLLIGAIAKVLGDK